MGTTALLLALDGMATPAWPFSERVKAACEADYRRLCPSYKPDSPSLRYCMESQALSISQRCIDALTDSGEIRRKSSKR